MAQHDNYSNEHTILDSSIISIKGINFRVILTNSRVILINALTQKQNDIYLSELQRIKSESGLNGEPTILLFIHSPTGESKRMIFTFPPGNELERTQWFTAIDEMLRASQLMDSRNTNISNGNSRANVQQPDSFFCSKCGKKVISGSLFCNHCGAKIPSPVQDIKNINYERTAATADKPLNINDGKITLPSRKTGYSNVDTPYIKSKKFETTPNYKEPITNKFRFALPNISLNAKTGDKSNVAVLCCGGFILLIIISAIFSAFTNNTSSSNTYTSISPDTTTERINVPAETTKIVNEPEEVVDTYLFTYQNVGATFPVKIPANAVYEYLSENVTSKHSKDEVGIVVSSFRSQWRIFDYQIVNTEKKGNKATVTVDIIWQTNSGVQITQTAKIPLVFEDNEWKLDEFFYSM